MNQDQRKQARQVFLDQQGWGDVACPLLAGDASFRKYYRLKRGEETRVLMDAPPPHEDIRPFIQIGQKLLEAGFSAPTLYGHDAEAGFLLLEDLGDQTYTTLLGQGHDEDALYDLALDALVTLHQTDFILEDVPAYDRATLQREADLLIDWWLPAALEDHALDEGISESYHAAWTSVFDHLPSQGTHLVLRDYHVDNLLRLDGRAGVKACGLLDFQDALVGHPIYDVMSLLEDARRDLDLARVERLKKRYCQAVGMDRAEFDQAFAILGAQRHAKVIGIFVRLMVRDGKGIYLHHIPRVWGLLDRALQHPDLAPVKEWIDSVIPADRKGIPACLAL